MRKYTLVLCLLSVTCVAQQGKPGSATGSTLAPQSIPSHTATGTSTPASQNSDPNATPTNAEVDAKIKTALDAQDKHPDFELSIGIGSLVNAPGVSDYTNQSNILEATNLGRASPQYLVGISLRTPFPNFHHRGNGLQLGQCKTSPPAGQLGTGRSLGDPFCDYWRLNPWKAFVNLKFSTGASQTLNGFVLGGSYQFAHYIDALLGFGFTPVNEASQGLRVTASQFVTAQQKVGNDLNFDPNAMLLGSKNAFDGFPLTDSTGKLIYVGNPLEVHYRGGVVLGIAIPINFSSALGAKTQ